MLWIDGFCADKSSINLVFQIQSKNLPGFKISKIDEKGKYIISKIKDICLWN